MNEWVWSIGGMIPSGETELLGEKHYTASVADEYGPLVEWWQEKLNYQEKNQAQCHFVQHKSHLESNLAVRGEKD